VRDDCTGALDCSDKVCAGSDTAPATPAPGGAESGGTVDAPAKEKPTSPATGSGSSGEGGAADKGRGGGGGLDTGEKAVSIVAGVVSVVTALVLCTCYFRRKRASSQAAQAL
jgi:hypothetical protein